MKNKTIFTITLLLYVALFFIAGCATKNIEAFTRESVSLAYIDTVAVLPFENNTADGAAASRIREMLMTEIMASGLFETAEKGIVDSAMREEAIQPGEAMDEIMIRRLAQRLDAKALLMGSVDEMNAQSMGSYSYLDLVLSMRLVDSETGTVLWQATGFGSGYSTWKRLFGFGGKNRYQVILDLIRDMFETMGVTSDVAP